MAPLPLEGIRVLDYTIVWAGPFASMMLADLGAEVIRVESTNFFPYCTRGLIARPPDALLKSAGQMMGGYPNKEAGERPWNRCSFFNHHARNKLSMTVDATKPEGKEIFKKLLKVSDVYIENNAYGTVQRLGLDYEAAKEVNPDIIMVSMPAFGSSGPYRDYVALGRHLEALSGHTLLRAYPDENPGLNSEVYHCDAVAGGVAAFATLMGLHHRSLTGEGQFIEVCQWEAMLPQLGEIFMDFFMNQRIQQALGNRDESAAPCGCYPCKGEDKWINITVFTDKQWEGFCRALGNLSWMAEQRFSDLLRRWQNQDELDKHVAEWTAERDPYEAMHILQSEGVAAGVVMTPADCYSDPHLEQRGFFELVTQVDSGTYLSPGMGWKMSKTQGSIRMPPCRLGEHNEYVYKEILGISDEEYDELEKKGHIGMDFDESISVRGKAQH